MKSWGRGSLPTTEVLSNLTTGGAFWVGSGGISVLGLKEMLLCQ